MPAMMTTIMPTTMTMAWQCGNNNGKDDGVVNCGKDNVVVKMAV